MATLDRTSLNQRKGKSMNVDFYLVAVCILGAFAVFDLFVGVSNDAVNFLNPAIGARAASRRWILIFAGLGILAGVTFSSGMMEVARKGIFHPEYFTMPDLLAIFLAVMITDVILLDTFSSNGLPTSTTVSVVFELLGAATAVSLAKILDAGDSLARLGEYVNTSKAMAIIGGIFFAVVAAFVAGAVVQFVSRMIFTFDYSKTIRRYGALWGGLAMSAVAYFILIKGAKGASFMTPETVHWIKTHTRTILFGIAAVSAAGLEILSLMGVNVFKPVIMLGTFAIAMAFAANDLVNFIGVPMAGWNAYSVAARSADPATASMAPLAGKVPAATGLLLVAGAIMALTLWISKKARTVIGTGVDLSRQEEGVEQFGASFISRAIVRGALGAIGAVRAVTPAPLRRAFARRFDVAEYGVELSADGRPSFDLLRAAVNIMVASALISYGTANKLPLSTTYVTFMVAMGASFADRAWGRESAVYRVTGVLAVAGGWLMTALVAFVVAGLAATALFFGGAVALALLLGAVVFVLRKNHGRHARRLEEKEQDRIFNLEKVSDVGDAAETTFSHVARLLRIVSESVERATDALFKGNVYVLKEEVARSKKVRKWSNVIIANAFKSLRLADRMDESHGRARNYLQIVRRLQKISDGHADVAVRAYEHVANHHKGLTSEQVEDLREFVGRFRDLMAEASERAVSGKPTGLHDLQERKEALKALSGALQRRQLDRIQAGEAKTRLSILYFALLGNLYMLASQVFQLLNILEDSLAGTETGLDVYSE